jgi:hypothetical protein
MLEGSLVRRRLNSNGALAPVGKDSPKKKMLKVRSRGLGTCEKAA